MLHLLDWFFFLFHNFVILFNLFGWVWKRTRRANLLLLLLTAFSWFFLGIWYGWGYCMCTDWHWQVLEKLGRANLPNSYITYLLQRINTNWQVPQNIIDTATAACFFLALVASVVVNFIDWRKRKVKTVYTNEFR